MSGNLIGISQLAKKLNVSENTIRAWVQKGHIPRHTYLVIGPNVRRYDYDAIIAHFKKDNTKPDTDPAQLELNLGTDANPHQPRG